jgi:hypothetical protein
VFYLLTLVLKSATFPTQTRWQTLEMKKIKILLILTICLFSCKSDHLQKVLRTSKHPELDLVFYTIVKAEYKEMGKSIAIIDKASDRNNQGIAEFNILTQNESQILYWNKLIFPNAKYISSDSLTLYRKDENKFWDFAEKQKNGWIELSEPIFTKNKDRVIIQVEFLNAIRRFGATVYYILEKKNGKYLIVDKQIVSIN